MTSHTKHNNPLYQHKHGIINSLKFFLPWTGGSILAVFLGFMLRLGSGLAGWVGFLFIMTIPYMLVIIIIQSAIMTCFFSYLRQHNPDRIPRLYRLSRYLFAAVANAVWAPSAVMALNSRSAMKFFIIWLSISTVVCGVILFVTKTAPLLMPPIYVLVMLQSVIATVYRFKSPHHSPKK